MTAPTSSLPRALGLLSTTLLVVGGIIGGGIFFTPSVVAQQLPDANWIVAVWTLGGIVALAGALTYAELGAMLPESGGPYVYIREAFGPLPAFLCAWMTITSVASASSAAVALAFAGYVSRGIGVSGTPALLALAAAAIVGVTLTNYLGIRPGAALQNLLTLAKLGALGALVLGGVILWHRLPSPPPAVAPPPPDNRWVGLAAAFVPVLFSIGGWQQMNMVAAEVKDPERTIPRALVLGVTVVLVVYVSVNVICLHALGRDGVAASTAVAADTARRFIGPVGAKLIGLAATLSLLGVLNVVILTNSRMLFALGRDGGRLLAPAAAVHRRFGTPHIALVVLGGWTLVLLLLSQGNVGQLLDAVVFADWIFFGLGGASLFVLRRTRPAAPRPYRVWGYPLIPAFFVVAAFAGVSSIVIHAPGATARGMVLLAIGWLVGRRRPSST